MYALITSAVWNGKYMIYILFCLSFHQRDRNATELLDNVSKYIRPSFPIYCMTNTSATSSQQCFLETRHISINMLFGVPYDIFWYRFNIKLYMNMWMYLSMYKHFCV